MRAAEARETFPQWAEDNRPLLHLIAAYVDEAIAESTTHGPIKGVVRSAVARAAQELDAQCDNSYVPLIARRLVAADSGRAPYIEVRGGSSRVEDLEARVGKLEAEAAHWRQLSRKLWEMAGRPSPAVVGMRPQVGAGGWVPDGGSLP